LSKIGGAESIQPVAACIPNIDSRYAARDALVAFGPAAENAVIKLLGHSDHNVRALACEILIPIGTQNCLPAIQQATKDPEHYVSSTASSALMQITKRLSGQ
jgi:HEAT repeat protein